MSWPKSSRPFHHGLMNEVPHTLHWVIEFQSFMILITLPAQRRVILEGVTTRTKDPRLLMTRPHYLSKGQLTHPLARSTTGSSAETTLVTFRNDFHSTVRKRRCRTNLCFLQYTSRRHKIDSVRTAEVIRLYYKRGGLLAATPVTKGVAGISGGPRAIHV